MKHFSKLILSLLLFTGTLFSCKTSQREIAVFIPGIMADSATYAKLAQGVTKAIDEYNTVQHSEKDKVKLTVIEAGTTQSQWQPKITSLAASKKYEVIISSNPSLPQIALEVLKDFPEQKFILLDGELSGNPGIYTVSYDQREQAYISGYMAGLSSKSKKLGLVAAQEYPIMNEVFRPYFLKGAQKADPSCTVEFRIVGNWYDATKGSEITKALASIGVDVILPIAGGAGQGVIAAAKETGIKLVWFDENGYSKAPGTILCCTQVHQDKAGFETAKAYLEGKIEFGTCRKIGSIADGFTELISDNENYQNTNSEEVKEKMSALIEKLRVEGLSE